MVETINVHRAQYVERQLNWLNCVRIKLCQGLRNMQRKKFSRLETFMQPCNRKQPSSSIYWWNASRKMQCENFSYVAAARCRYVVIETRSTALTIVAPRSVGGSINAHAWQRTPSTAYYKITVVIIYWYTVNVPHCETLNGLLARDVHSCKSTVIYTGDNIALVDRQRLFHATRRHIHLEVYRLQFGFSNVCKWHTVKLRLCWEPSFNLAVVLNPSCCVVWSCRRSAKINW